MILAPLLAALAVALAMGGAPSTDDEPGPREEDFYRLVALPLPEPLVLEVSGIALLPDGRPLVCTRAGEVFVLENAYDDPPQDVLYRKAFEGLAEPLGLDVQPDGWVYVTQRGELSRLRDTDGDDRFDELETVCDEWRISGNYHEYNFGPRRAPDGSFWITLNKPFGGQPFGDQKWRGFAVRVTPDGRMEPMVSGLRSPAGIQFSPGGEPFYTDNQGEWCGAGKLSLLEPGSFQGHPHGIDSCHDPLWPWPHPGEIPDRVLMPQVAQRVESFRLPAVWFPYDEMGRSPAGFVWDTTGGAFGPFEGQVFVSDQYQASVLRVSLERVNGRWQGACYPFRRRLGCGVIRVAWGADGSLLLGETDRGWASLGTNGRGFGLERLVWTGRVPFEVLEMRARPGGFELEFTRPVDPTTAGAAASYTMSSYTYLLHSDYGSPEVETRELELGEPRVSPDGRRVTLEVDGLRAGYVHELRLDGVRSVTGEPLLHARAYYTLVEIPAGELPAATAVEAAAAPPQDANGR